MTSRLACTLEEQQYPLIQTAQSFSHLPGEHIFTFIVFCTCIHAILNYRVVGSQDRIYGLIVDV